MILKKENFKRELVQLRKENQRLQNQLALYEALTNPRCRIDNTECIFATQLRDLYVKVQGKSPEKSKVKVPAQMLKIS